MAVGLIERKSGIVTPTHELSKKHRVMARAKFLRLVRAMGFASGEGLSLRFMCKTCKAMVSLQRGDSGLLVTEAAAVNPKRDPFTLTCDCTVRTVR